MTVIATAGHVDHGKSTLVLGLTGTDPDRWNEEKERGLTIDLGFAAITLPSGQPLSFIDVPGHIKFLRNMLSGVGAVDGCLFVVSAVEGWKPQSEEHLQILNILGMTRGVIAVTKVDLVDEELFELAKMDVEDHVANTFLADAPIVGVSATNGTGMDQLKAELDSMVADIDRNTASNKPRLWVDRSFAPAGAGTVVTGTLTGGALATNDNVVVAPGLRSVRIRSLQNHSQSVDSVGPGNRVAVNLTGINHTDINRGDVLVENKKWHHSQIVDAELTVLPKLDHPVTRQGAFVAYVGSATLPVKVRVLRQANKQTSGTHQEVIEPGETGAIRLYLDRPIPVIPGDRYVLRESGRNETVGGGQLLDIDPVLPASTATPDRSVERLVAERGWVEAEQLSRLTGEQIEPTIGPWVVDPDVRQQADAELRVLIEAAGSLGCDLASLTDHQRLLVEASTDMNVTAGYVTIGEPQNNLSEHWWLAELKAGGYTPPKPDGVDKSELRELVRRGHIIEQDGIYFAVETVAAACGLIATALADQPQGLTVAECRDLLSTSRKYVLALLAHLDQTGMTRRREDVRIAGPRLTEQSLELNSGRRQ